MSTPRSTTRSTTRQRAVPALALSLAALVLAPQPSYAAPPVASSGPSMTVVAGTDAQLQGSVSDPDGDALEIHWMATVISQGDVSSCTFTGPWGWSPVTPEGLAPTLNCATPGKYLLQLVVGDGTSSDDDIGAQITFTDPDTTPATCTLLPWLKGSAKLRIGDAESGLASYTVLDTHNLTIKPLSRQWSPPTSSTSLPWSRPGRGAGTALVTHTNGAGVSSECLLFVRRNGTATVVS